MLQYDVVNPAKWHNYGATVIGSIKLGYSNLYRHPPCRGTGKLHGGRAFFPNGKFHGGRHSCTGNSKEGVKITYEMLEIPWEGGK